MFGKIRILRELLNVNEILEETIGDIPELELTMGQKKLILFLVSKVDNHDDYKSTPIKTADFCNLFDIEQDDNMYQKINAEITDLSRKIFLLPTINVKSRRMCMWITGGHIDYEKDAVYFKLSPTFKYYYRYLKKQIT
jgi:hypothetical protein